MCLTGDPGCDVRDSLPEKGYLTEVLRWEGSRPLEKEKEGQGGQT